MAKEKCKAKNGVIFVCAGTKCRDNKAKKLKKRIAKLIEERGLDAEVKIRTCSCLGACGAAPVVHIPCCDKRIKKTKPKDAERILDMATGEPR